MLMCLMFAAITPSRADEVIKPQTQNEPANQPHVPPVKSVPAPVVRVDPNRLDALVDTESLSAFLNKRDDALRERDLATGYYVPVQAFGNLVPQLSPIRRWLDNRGYNFQFAYKGEALANVGGGLSKGMSYAHELTLVNNFDLGKLLGLDGWILHGVLMERAGRQVSYDHVGEHRILLSEVYSLSGHAAAHLADIYVEKTFLHNSLNINVGRLTLTHTYATSVLLCTFMVQCSAPPAVKSVQGWSVYPKATWGGTMRLRPTRDLTLRTGVYASADLNKNPSGWAWGSEDVTGVMLPIELTWEPFLGPKRLPGHYKFGFGHDTSGFADLIGKVPPAMNQFYRAHQKESRNTFYVEVDQMIYRSHGEHQMAGGYLMAGYVHNTPQVSVFSDEVYIGTSLLGIIPYRPYDRFGVMYSYYQMSNRLTLGQTLRYAAGLPYEAFVNGPQTHAAILEAYYGVPVVPGLIIQPSFEYMMRPGETSVIPNATVIGLKVLGNL
ncbi:carbohydrate-selective porin B [Kozakia baliensis NRIC 0488]|nr:carbohydrate-selective porin B [Kozakia baliensis NRIC 0488]